MNAESPLLNAYIKACVTDDGRKGMPSKRAGAGVVYEGQEGLLGGFAFNVKPFSLVGLQPTTRFAALLALAFSPLGGRLSSAFTSCAIDDEGLDSLRAGNFDAYPNFPEKLKPLVRGSLARSEATLRMCYPEKGLPSEGLTVARRFARVGRDSDTGIRQMRMSQDSAPEQIEWARWDALTR